MSDDAQQAEPAPGRRLALTSWHDEMSTGDDEIDRQHRDLLDKVDDLLMACRDCRMGDEVGRLFWFLKRYVRRHFRDEERLQADSGYPGCAAHKAEHAAFYLEVQRLEARYREQGASSTVIVESLHLMCEWLHSHFRGADRALVEYLHGAGSVRAD